MAHQRKKRAILRNEAELYEYSSCIYLIGGQLVMARNLRRPIWVRFESEAEFAEFDGWFWRYIKELR